MTLNSDSQLRYESLKQAAEWFVKINDAKLTSESRQEWLLWLDASENNRHAWLEIEKTQQNFLNLAEDSNSTAAANILTKQNNRISRRSLLALSMLSGVGLVSAFNWRTLSPVIDGWASDLSTPVGGIKQHHLPDQSQVWLNTNSAVNVHFTDRLRSLTMLSGEIYIATQADRLSRRFIVKTPVAQFEALGTKFSIKLLTKKAELIVTEGAVKIDTQYGESKVIAAGEVAQIGRRGIEVQATSKINQPSWINGLLMADNMPLSEVIRELSRYHYVHIEVSPEISALRVTGSYPLADINKTLNLISSTLNLSVQRYIPWWYAIESKS